MNYFAHARFYLDRPYFMAGTAVPDWLAVADQAVRVRSKYIEEFRDEADPIAMEVAAGALQHLRDDARFHATRAFAETSLELTGLARGILAGKKDSPLFADAKIGTVPPAPVSAPFLGHLLVELLLDASLIADAPDRLTEYYRVLDAVDAQRVEAAVNRFARRPTERLAPFIELFRRERILWDYAEDGKLMVRLNQIMRRVGLAVLPDEFAAMLPAARRLVVERRSELLESVNEFFPRREPCVTE